MNPAIIAGIAILLAVVCMILIFRFGKAFFKVFSVVFFFGVIGLIIFGALVVNDAMNFKDGIATNSNIFFLHHGEDVVAGIVLLPPKSNTGADIYEQRLFNVTTEDMREVGGLSSTEGQNEKGFEFVSLDVLDSYEQYYESESFDNVSSSHFKFFFFNTSVFEDFENETVEFGLGNLTVDEALTALYSDDVIVYLGDKFSSQDSRLTSDMVQEQLESQIGKRGNMRGLLFSLLLSKITGGEQLTSITPIISYFKTSEIEVFPSTIMFDVIGVLSDNLIEAAAEQVVGTQ